MINFLSLKFELNRSNFGTIKDTDTVCRYMLMAIFLQNTHIYTARSYLMHCWYPKAFRHNEIPLPCIKMCNALSCDQKLKSSRCISEILTPKVKIVISYWRSTSKGNLVCSPVVWEHVCTASIGFSFWNR